MLTCRGETVRGCMSSLEPKSFEPFKTLDPYQTRTRQKSVTTLLCTDGSHKEVSPRERTYPELEWPIWCDVMFCTNTFTPMRYQGLTHHIPRLELDAGFCYAHFSTSDLPTLIGFKAWQHACNVEKDPQANSYTKMACEP